MSYPQLSIVGTLTVQMNLNLRLGQNFYLLTNAKELLTSLSTRHSETPKQGDHGVEGSLSQYGARLLTFEGQIHAQSVTQRVTMEKNLRTCLSLPRSQSYSGDDGYKLIRITDEDGHDKQFYAKIVDMPEFSYPYEGRTKISAFRFAMIAEDPFLYDQTLTEESGPEAVFSTTFPLQDGSLLALQDGSLPALQESLVYGITVQNIGTIGAPPLITITGPTSSPVITNETTGRSMSLSGLTLLADERVEIDVSSYAITKYDASDVSSDVSGYLTTDSEWIFIEPGENQISLLDDSPETLEAAIEVDFRSAWD